MKSNNRIVIKTAKNGQPFFDLKTGNNKPLVTSETYKSERALQNAIKAVQKVVRGAEVDDKR